MTNSKIQKFQEELERNEGKITALKERNRELEQKIREAETMEIFALMRSEGLSMDDLVALARSRKENSGLPSFSGKLPDAADGEADDDTDYRRKEYGEDEDDEDEYDE